MGRSPPSKALIFSCEGTLACVKNPIGKCHYVCRKHLADEERCDDRNCTDFGSLAEWFKASVLKTAVPKGTRGSNPLTSSKIHLSQIMKKKCEFGFGFIKACQSPPEDIIFASHPSFLWDRKNFLSLFCKSHLDVVRDAKEITEDEFVAMKILRE
jgi:hypothetical protein